MYDFTNLSDIEFERLSADIISRKLGVKLRYFAPGRDGGIDLVDDTVQRNIVVQVKHYAKSSFSKLLNSLKKEVDKVKKINPKQYYICVSQELTADNISSIYSLFSDYMYNTSNIIDKNELVNFLNEVNNQDILRKNYKLWLLSDKLLKDIFNNEVFIDGEILLDDINEDFKFFVQTKLFDDALDILQKQRVIMLYGAPGVGKSITSKMLSAAFVKEDYIIRYTTDGEVSRIKSVISANSDMKEVILLDDCLGQYYFNLKLGQDRELISLIKYINQHKNKILILNTRVTILNEAKRSRFEFRNFLDRGTITLKTIDMDDISLKERAEIFYNHLLRNKIPKSYFESLKLDKRYKEIIQHKNYNPRIIEFISQEIRYSEVKPEEYHLYILKNLDNPIEVWADEFDEKLNEFDRIFMHTLFSLTDTYIEINVLKECFIYRLQNEGKAESTINYFSIIKTRLTKSLIKIIDIDGKQMIGVLNPSINDYMNNSLKSNCFALTAIKNSILYIEQLTKVYDNNEMKTVILAKLNSEEYLNLKSINDNYHSYLYYGIGKNIITKDSYKQLIIKSFNKLNDSVSIFNTVLKKEEIIVPFLEEKDLFNFYSINEYINDKTFIDDLLDTLDYEGIAKIIFTLNNERLITKDTYFHCYQKLIDELDYYLSGIEVDEYIDDIDGFEVFYSLMPPEEHQENIDKEIELLLVNIKNILMEELEVKLKCLIDFAVIKGELKVILEDYISDDAIFEALERHFHPEPDFDYEPDHDDIRGYDSGNSDVIDVIFNRELDYNG